MKSIVLILFIMSCSVAAYLLKSLTIKGAITAFVVGSLIAYGGGSYGLCLLGIFFMSSAYWSSYKEERKYHLYHLHEKGTTRDSIQVLANGLLPALCCLGYAISKQEVFLVAMAVSLASSTADTWASEIGVLSKNPPRSIVTFKVLEKGLSGGITVLGSFAQVAGACFIAIVGASWLTFIYKVNASWSFLFISISLLGILGSIIDSYLGIFLQVKYECKVCHLITERRFHHGLPTKRVNGCSLITNDVVNLLSQMIVTGMVFFLIK